MDPADCAHPKLAKLDMDRCPDCGAVPTDMSHYDTRAPDEDRTHEVGRDTASRDQAGIDVLNDVLEDALGPPPADGQQKGAVVRIKTTCEHHACDDESTHVAHWEELGAAEPVFLCAAHAYRRRDGAQPRVESLVDYTTADSSKGRPEVEHRKGPW